MKQVSTIKERDGTVHPPFLRCYLDDKFPKIVTTATPMLLKFHLRETMYGISNI